MKVQELERALKEATREPKECEGGATMEPDEEDPRAEELEIRG